MQLEYRAPGLAPGGLTFHKLLVVRLVGASGFEPPTSWSRKMQSKNPSASFGVAWEPEGHSFSPSVVPKLYRPVSAIIPYAVSSKNAGSRKMQLQLSCPRSPG